MEKEDKTSSANLCSSVIGQPAPIPSSIRYFTLHHGGKSKNLPLPRQGHIMIHRDGVLYIHAGRVPGEQRKRAYVSDMWKFSYENKAPIQNKNVGMLERISPVDLNFSDPQSNTVSSLDDKGWPTPRHNHTGVVYNGKLYIFGGSGYSGYFNDLLRYNFTKNTWKVIHLNSNSTKSHKQYGDIPSPRHGHTAILHNDNMVIFGGKNGPELGLQHFNDIYFWNFTSFKWTKINITSRFQSIPPAPHPRCWHACIGPLWEKYLIVFGGFYMVGKTEKYFNDVWIFDLDSMSWQEIFTSEPKIAMRNRVISVGFEVKNEEMERDQKNNKFQIWIQGGNYFNSKTRKDAWFSDSWMLLLERKEKNNIDSFVGTWKMLDPSSEATVVVDRGHHTVAVDNFGNILIFGGEKKRKRFNDFLLAKFS